MAGKLEGRQVVAQVVPGRGIQADGCADTGRGNPGRNDRPGPRKQLAGCRSDKTEGALCTDEQLLEIVAGVVLAQAPQTVEHTAVGQHHLQAQHEITHRAEPQYCSTAGIGRNRTAQLTAALRRKTERK